MKNNIINIAFSINKKFIPYCAVTMASILKNANENLSFNFFVLSINDLSNDLMNIKFPGYDNFKIFNITVDATELKNLKASGYLQKHVTIDAFLRCYIPKLLNEIDKCIYLDSDLVVNTNIGMLYDIELNEFYAGAVVENTYAGEFRKGDMKLCREMFLKKYLIKDDFYFNAGVVLFNLKKIRSDCAETLILETIAKYGQSEFISFGDQDYINIAYQGFSKGKMMPIDFRWNAFQILRQPRENNYIMHWTGINKPWNSFAVPHLKVYLEYAQLTTFYPKIRSDLLEVIENKLSYLNTGLPYKKYKRRLRIFDIRIFGRDIFPKTINRCKRRIDDFLRQKKEKELYYDYLIDLKNFLNIESFK